MRQLVASGTTCCPHVINLAPLALVWDELSSLDHILAKTRHISRYEVLVGGERARGQTTFTWGPVRKSVDLDVTPLGMVTKRQVLRDRCPPAPVTLRSDDPPSLAGLLRSASIIRTARSFSSCERLRATASPGELPPVRFQCSAVSIFSTASRKWGMRHSRAVRMLRV